MRSEPGRLARRLSAWASTGLALIAALLLGLPARADEACAADAAAVVGFLRGNDAGVVEELAQDGPARLDALDAELGRAAASAQGTAACADVLGSHLRAVRPGQLSLQWSGLPAAASALPPASAPVLPFEVSLQSGLPVLTLRSLSTAYQAELHAVIARMAPRWRQAGRLIIDLRGQTEAGSDGVWEPLRDLALGSAIELHGVRWWATPANAQVLDETLARFPDASGAWREAMQARIAALRAAPAGSWLPVGPASMRYEPPQAAQAIRHVALIVDRSCRDSCEQLVMELRGASNVVVWGRATLGALDAGNPGRHALPGGRATLTYAMSLTQRPRALQVDGKGIAPARDLGEVAPERWRAAVAACDLQWPCAEPPPRVAERRSTGSRSKASARSTGGKAGSKKSRAGTTRKSSRTTSSAAPSRSGKAKVKAGDRKSPRR
ncbi:hypothetical protein C7444_12339 [Sphaerotilus hippei]|uniref:Peptidase S41-like protein n=1 Tax=Sphaerotilus hippei TaxID=744406 RepID=A0A318GVH1_9BURK|nr:hypothetical protein [Sphaerotilus hippei]PXW92788.1 hypothetical protein C7444_12339 [Sphaerotilus hippei]